MKKRALVIYILFHFFLANAFLSAQNPSIQIEPDIRVFAVLAALQASGLQFEGRGGPVRAAILRDLDTIPAELKAKLGKFVTDHLEGKKAEDQVAKYVSLALLTDGPPEFALSLETKDLPPDALSVAEFLPLVKELYSSAKLESIWSGQRRYYDKAVSDYRPTINQIILTTDGYLRMVSGSFLDRRLFIIPDFLAPDNAFNARTYRDTYYLVFSPAEKLATGEFRHQYLHFLLDPYALRFTLNRDTRLALAKLAESGSGIEERYRSDIQFLVTESLIRAIELRMGKVPEGEASVALDATIRAGGLLARHFYDALADFEAKPEGMRLYYPVMAKSVEMEKVSANFTEAQKTIPIVEKKPEPTEVEKMLRTANTNLGNNNLANAAEGFQQVLQTYDENNGEALYGLGIIASIQNRREIAKDYFSRALQSPKSEKATKVWSHIYLGRIADLEENRQEAVQQYQSAIDSGDNTRNAQEVAQKGLREPFNPRKSGTSP